MKTGGRGKIDSYSTYFISLCPCREGTSFITIHVLWPWSFIYADIDYFAVQKTPIFISPLSTLNDVKFLKFCKCNGNASKFYVKC